MTTAIRDNTSADRYEITVDGEPAGFLSYRREGGRIVLLHTEIYDEFRGRGLGNELIGSAIDEARRAKLAIEPHCSFVAAYLAKERTRGTRDVSLTGIPAMGRATVIGALLGAVVVGAAVTTGLLLAGTGPTAIAAGAHVGFFGGMGYGGMVAAVVQSDRYEKREAASARSRKDDVQAAAHGSRQRTAA